eukprot:6184738-Pleurochrysis_carterae.AAC.1
MDGGTSGGRRGCNRQRQSQHFHWRRRAGPTKAGHTRHVFKDARRAAVRVNTKSSGDWLRVKIKSAENIVISRGVGGEYECRRASLGASSPSPCAKGHFHPRRPALPGPVLGAAPQPRPAATCLTGAAAPAQTPCETQAYGADRGEFTRQSIMRAMILIAGAAAERVRKSEHTSKPWIGVQAARESSQCSATELQRMREAWGMLRQAGREDVGVAGEKVLTQTAASKAPVGNMRRAD